MDHKARVRKAVAVLLLRADENQRGSARDASRTDHSHRRAHELDEVVYRVARLDMSARRIDVDVDRLVAGLRKRHKLRADARVEWLRRIRWVGGRLRSGRRRNGFVGREMGGQ